MRIALAYAFGELLEDVGRWLVVGLVVATLITAAVPDNFFSVLQQWPLVNMLLVLLLAIPMYICATGSIPIAMSLIIKGMTPGAAFVMLMAGPAINAASMLVIDKTLGRRQMTIYITTIIIGALAFGLAIDYLLPSQWFMPPAATMTATGHCENCTEHETSLFSIVCGAAFTILLARALWHRHTGHSACTCHDGRRSCHNGDCSCHDKAEEEKEERCQCHNGACTDSARQIQMSFSVEGMRCSHCATNVREALTALPEIDSADVDLPSGHVTVTIKERCTISADTITDAISKAGYKASAL